MFSARSAPLREKNFPQRRQAEKKIAEIGKLISCLRTNSIRQNCLNLYKVYVKPEVFRKFGFVFFFYANEGQEPMHVHVRKAGGFAKFWIEPIELEFAQGLKVQDLSKAQELILENSGLIKSKWDEVFGG